MSSAIIQLLVLAGIAVFLVLRLRSVLGTREGFEKPPVSMPDPAAPRADDRRPFEVIEGGVDTDITDHVPEDSESAKALAAMKQVEPGFSVSEFLHGARGAYEMILMAFEHGTLEEVRAFLAPDVYESFAEVLKLRQDQGLSVEANFVGVRELTLKEASFDEESSEADLTVRFVGELTSVVRNKAGDVIEGSPNEIKRQRDVWTFARAIGSDDPNWQLVATGE
jgi:predicted lipid-binding transport protein (Tim44 family)